jgi:predicted HTH transcriptional regulator
LKKSEYVDALSKHLSGFANTEGGRLILGLETTKTGNEPDTATALDKGLAFKDLSPETVQRALEASISPPLPGLRFLPIRTENDKGRYYLVIEVPKSA